MNANDFVGRIRGREKLVGYWVTLDSPAAAERIGGLGYDYVVLDAQHGLIGCQGLMTGLLAIDAGAAIGPRQSVGLVRVEANDPTPIGRALDAGATGVIVPLVDSADDVARAVRAAKSPPVGARSFGPSARRCGSARCRRTATRRSPRRTWRRRARSSRTCATHQRRSRGPAHAQRSALPGRCRGLMSGAGPEHSAVFSG